MHQVWIGRVTGVLMGTAVLWVAGPSAAQSAALPAQVVSRASVASDGTRANGDSFGPALSQDGRVVAFQSQATNLGGSCITANQIYVHDRATGATSCVSVNGSGIPGNNASASPTLSADGRLVAFASLATNLGGGCVSGLLQTYVHDR